MTIIRKFILILILIYFNFIIGQVFGIVINQENEKLPEEYRHKNINYVKTNTILLPIDPELNDVADGVYYILLIEIEINIKN